MVYVNTTNAINFPTWKEGLFSHDFKNNKKHFRNNKHKTYLETIIIMKHFENNKHKTYFRNNNNKTFWYQLIQIN